MKTVGTTANKEFVTCCVVQSSASFSRVIFTTQPPFLPYQSKHIRWYQTLACTHIHSNNRKTDSTGEVSQSLRRQLDDNPDAVTRLKVTHISSTHPFSFSSYFCRIYTPTHTHTLIKSCNQADFCMY